MIKRRFYKQDHGDESDASSSSDSDSDSESIPEEGLNAVEEDEKEVSGENEEEEVEEEEEDVEKGSGYNSEDSSANEIVDETSDLQSSEEADDEGTLHENLEDKQTFKLKLGIKESTRSLKNSSEDDDCILQHKSVFKCRICPRVVCLSEESLIAHLKSKGHARSKKLLQQGRLKVTLNSDGEMEEEEETHAERHARMVSIAQITSSGPDKKKKNRGRQRQSQRRKAKLERQPEVLNKTDQKKMEKRVKKKPKTKD